MFSGRCRGLLRHRKSAKLQNFKSDTAFLPFWSKKASSQLTAVRNSIWKQVNETTVYYQGNIGFQDIAENLN